MWSWKGKRRVVVVGVARDHCGDGLGINYRWVRNVVMVEMVGELCGSEFFKLPLGVVEELFVACGRFVDVECVEKNVF